MDAVTLVIMLLVGAAVGAVAGWIMKAAYPWYVDILLGIVGAFVGNLVAGLFGYSSSLGFDPVGLIFSVIGAVIVIAIIRAIRR